MSIDGRFQIDVLFHDTDGASSMKILSMDSGETVTSGKVALVTGTIGTATLTFSRQPIAYTAADGGTVSFSFVERVALQASPHVELTTAPSKTYFASGNRVGVYELTGSERTASTFSVRTTTGTATYSLLVYGS